MVDDLMMKVETVKTEGSYSGVRIILFELEMPWWPQDDQDDPYKNLHWSVFDIAQFDLADHKNEDISTVACRWLVKRLEKCHSKVMIESDRKPVKTFKAIERKFFRDLIDATLESDMTLVETVA